MTVGYVAVSQGSMSIAIGVLILVVLLWLHHRQTNNRLEEIEALLFQKEEVK